MAVVGVVAVDLAAGRAVLTWPGWFEWNVEFLLAVAPVAVLLEVAAFRYAHNLGRDRVFWAGFLLSGAATTASILVGLSEAPHNTFFSSFDGTVSGTVYLGG